MVDGWCDLNVIKTNLLQNLTCCLARDSEQKTSFLFAAVWQLKLAASEQEKQSTAQSVAKDIGKCMLSSQQQCANLLLVNYIVQKVPLALLLPLFR